MRRLLPNLSMIPPIASFLHFKTICSGSPEKKHIQACEPSQGSRPNAQRRVFYRLLLYSASGQFGNSSNLLCRPLCRQDNSSDCRKPFRKGLQHRVRFFALQAVYPTRIGNNRKKPFSGAKLLHRECRYCRTHSDYPSFCPHPPM